MVGLGEWCRMLGLRSCRRVKPGRGSRFGTPSRSTILVWVGGKIYAKGFASLLLLESTPCWNRSLKKTAGRKKKGRPGKKSAAGPARIRNSRIPACNFLPADRKAPAFAQDGAGGLLMLWGSRWLVGVIRGRGDEACQNRRRQCPETKLKSLGGKRKLADWP